MKQKDKRRVRDRVGVFMRESRFLSFDWALCFFLSPVNSSVDAIDVAPEAIIDPVCEVATF
jgi:hypothetical protein